jgi:hypothetical protein
MKNSLIVNTILIMFVLANVYSALVFTTKQKLGASFIESFDKAIVKGAWFFVLGSGLSFITVMYGNVPQVFI